MFESYYRMILYNDVVDVVKDGEMLNKGQLAANKFIGQLVELYDLLVQLLCQTKNRYGFDSSVLKWMGNVIKGYQASSVH